MKRFVGDFETATWLENETWVWAWCVAEIGNEANIKLGNNIASFFELCQLENNPIVYFHNLKFDGEFIISYLLDEGFTPIIDKKERKDKTFSCLISDMGTFYSIEIYFKVTKNKTKKVTIYDSLKIIPMPVKEIPKAFGLDIQKLDLDYFEPREKVANLKENEIKYITNDCLIVAKALKVLFDQKLNKMTQGSNALHNFKEILTKSRFEFYFPELTPEADADIRKAYKGGFTYLNPIYEEKVVGEGVVLDVNSLYPSVMYEKLLPFGEGIFFEGKYEKDNIYPLYIQSITCSFELKENKIPTIQLKAKDYKWEFLPNEYVTSSKGLIINLVLSSIDLKLFFENYNVYDLKFLNGWKFKGVKGIFSRYIDKWIKVKNESTLNGNKGMRTLAKLMLNSLYGKFATNLDNKIKVPFLDEEGVTRYILKEGNDKKTIYIPMGVFITAYAREKTIRTSGAIKEYSINKYGEDYYCYSDTDSIHTLLPIEELSRFCEIDPVKLGAWKHESSFSEAKFVRQKCYVEKFENEYNVTCAGLPKRCMYKKEKNSNTLYYKEYELQKNGEFKEVEKEFNINDFKVGFTCTGKLTYKHVKGGVLLVPTEFTLKKNISLFLK